MLLEISNLEIGSLHSPNEKSICHDLNFSVDHGETVGILGESGSGKSITALSILQILPPNIFITRGDILFSRVNGRMDNLSNTTIKNMQSIRGKEISMVFQEPMTSLNPIFSCGDQVLETIMRHQANPDKMRNPGKSKARYSKEAKDQVLSLFQKVKLKDPHLIYNSHPYQLSGGQKQRVMIAMAISCNPRLLIADEPTTALDVTVQRSILELIRELQAEMGMSILFITHDISVLLEIAKKIVVLKAGEIVEKGDIYQVINSPEHPYTKGLLACRASMKEKGRRLITLEDTPDQIEQIPLTTIPPGIINQIVPILTIQNLNLSFKYSSGIIGKTNQKQILYDINLELFKNETIGLVGESGSGKTTLGRSIMKLIENDNGLICFHGTPINYLSGKSLKNFRKKVQIIFQDPYSSLNPKYTIGEMISEPMRVHHLYHNAKDRKYRTLELLQQVNLDPGFYGRYPHEFSGGQRQRIGIARAMAVEPEVLILDESVSALDVSIQAQVLNLLNDLKRRYNLTYLFISHDLELVRYMSDRIVVLKDGKVIETGDAEEVFKNPKSLYTKNLLGYS